MKNSTLVSLFILLCQCLCLSLEAQTQRNKNSLIKKALFTGCVVDAKTKQPLEGTVVQAFGAENSDSSLISQQIADSLGHFAIEVKSGYKRIYLLAAYMGYHLERKPIYEMFTADTVRLDTLQLQPTDLILKSTFVRGHGEKFKVVGDSVIFNPLAFNLDKGARMDELMEQLPGVQISDGQYYWMGKPVVIIFNGKLLFLKAPTVLNSLPSEAIKNVKAYQKSDNDIDPNLQGKMVLDINVKKKWMEKWYGNARIGAGDHSKYVGQIQATSLSEQTPITIKANMNNIGEQNRYYGNWSYVDKLEPSTQQSIEAQMSRNKKIGENGFSSFSTNAHYLDTNKNINRYNNTSESLNDSSNNYSISKSHDFSCNKDAEWDLSGEQLTQKNKFNYSGELNHLENRTTGFSQTAQFDKDPYKLNASPLENIDSIHQAIVNKTVNKSYGANHLTSGHLLGNYIHNFNAKNNLIIKVDVNFNNNHDRNFNRSDIRYYQNFQKQNELVNHYTLSLNNSLSTNISVVWNVSLVKQFMNMKLSYSFKPEYSHAKEDLYKLERLGDIISFGQLPNDSLMSKAYDISNSGSITNRVGKL